MISRDLIVAIKLSEERQYKLAQRVGLHPTTLSKWIIGMQIPNPNDKKLVKLAKILGVKNYIEQ